MITLTAQVRNDLIKELAAQSELPTEDVGDDWEGENIISLGTGSVLAALDAVPDGTDLETEETVVRIGGGLFTRGTVRTRLYSPSEIEIVSAAVRYFLLDPTRAGREHDIEIVVRIAARGKGFDQNDLFEAVQATLHEVFPTTDGQPIVPQVRRSEPLETCVKELTAPCEDGGTHQPVGNETSDAWCSKCSERLLLPGFAGSHPLE